MILTIIILLVAVVVLGFTTLNLLKKNENGRHIDVLFAANMFRHKIYAPKKPLFFQNCELENKDAFIQKCKTELSNCKKLFLEILTQEQPEQNDISETLVELSRSDTLVLPPTENLINAILLVVSLYVFYKILQFFNVKTKKIWQRLWLFLLSFPMFYYSSIGYVDASLFLFIALSIYATTKNINWLFVLSILLGLCVKETIVICIPFYFFYQYSYNKNKTIIVTILTCLLVTILFLIIKNYAPVTNIISKNNFWIFNLKNAEINFTRFNTWGSFIFSFGIVGLLFINNLLKFNIKNMLANKLILACLASIVSAYFLYVLSYFSTIADGRIIWLTYFYMLLIVNGLPNKDK
jgi:hypothetical protein